MTAPEYLVEIMTKRHSMALDVAKRRSKAIIPYVRHATGYVEQSLAGPPELAFLPAYYAILDLMKVYILLGPRHADLTHHRHHGMSYKVHSKSGSRPESVGDPVFTRP